MERWDLECIHVGAMSEVLAHGKLYGLFLQSKCAPPSSNPRTVSAE